MAKERQRWKVGVMLVNFFSLLVLFSIIFILNQLGSDDKVEERTPVVQVETIQAAPAVAEPVMEPAAPPPSIEPQVQNIENSGAPIAAIGEDKPLKKISKKNNIYEKNNAPEEKPKLIVSKLQRRGDFIPFEKNQ